MYNQQYISFVVVLLAQVLPMLGIEVGSEELTSFVSVAVTIVFGLWGIIAGWRNGSHTLGGRQLDR